MKLLKIQQGSPQTKMTKGHKIRITIRSNSGQVLGFWHYWITKDVTDNVSFYFIYLFIFRKSMRTGSAGFLKPRRHGGSMTCNAQCTQGAFFEQDIIWSSANKWERNLSSAQLKIHHKNIHERLSMRYFPELRTRGNKMVRPSGPLLLRNATLFPAE